MPINRRNFVSAFGMAALSSPLQSKSKAWTLEPDPAGKTLKTGDGQTIRLDASPTRGRGLFARYCGTCHALRASRAVARVGPSLDFLRPPAPLVRRTIRDGSSGVSATMPPQILTGQDADDVAAYVAAVAGR